jgi:hypothetical protein
MGAIESNEDLDFDIDLDLNLPGSTSSGNNHDDNDNTTTTMSANTDDQNQRSIEALAEWFEQGQAKNIIVLSGAGVSTGMYSVHLLACTASNTTCSTRSPLIHPSTLPRFHFLHI